MGQCESELLKRFGDQRGQGSNRSRCKVHRKVGEKAPDNPRLSWATLFEESDTLVEAKSLAEIHFSVLGQRQDFP